MDVPVDHYGSDGSASFSPGRPQLWDDNASTIGVGLGHRNGPAF